MATFPTLSRKSIYPVIATFLWNTTIQTYQNGIEQRISNRSNVKRKFEVIWKYLAPADKVLLTDFYNARKGAYESFAWGNPEDSTSYTVRFQEDELNREYFTYNLWNFNKITLIEVL